MASLLAKKYSVSLSASNIKTCFERYLKTGESITAVAVPALDDYEVTTSGDEVRLDFADIIPASVVVEATIAGGAAPGARRRNFKVAHDDLRLPGARRDDPLRLFIHAIVGIIGSSVALLTASFVAVASKDTPVHFRGMFIQLMEWMAAVVFIATAVAILLQLARMWSQAVRPKWKPAFVALGTLLIAIPLFYGYCAAQTAIQSGLDAPPPGQDGAATPAPASATPQSPAPWPLRIFLIFPALIGQKG